MTRLALTRRWVTGTALVLLALSGVWAYRTLPQAEDPGFTIRTAVVRTLLPGATPEQVARLVTDPVTERIQQIAELDQVRSESRTGASLVYVEFQERYTDMRPIFDDLRREMADLAPTLPRGTRGPLVDDDFGDVYGIIYTVASADLHPARLADLAEEARDHLLRLPDVASVELYGAPDERIWIEYDPARLAAVGLAPRQLRGLLARRNILASGGALQTGAERLVIQPTGNLASLQDLRDVVLVHPRTGEVLRLGDLATVRRGLREPPRVIVRSDGVRAVGVGVAMHPDGNIVELGRRTDALIASLQQQAPVGATWRTAYFQPDRVEQNVADFLRNLLQAVAIVMALMLVFLGLRTGLVVASLIPLTMLASLAVMKLVGISLNTISISSLIIALGLLVDNAIVMSEAIAVQMQRGKEAVAAAIAAARELWSPLLVSSLTTAAAFLPIYLAESSTGEYTSHLFEVVTITLLASWLLSQTLIPLACVRFLRVRRGDDPGDGPVDGDEDAPGDGRTRAAAADRAPARAGSGTMARVQAHYRRFLLAMLRRRWRTLGMVLLLGAGAVLLGRTVPVIFFPASDRTLLRATLELPEGVPLRRTAAVVADLEEHLADRWRAGPDRDRGVTGWISFVGRGTPRYVLPAQVDPPRRHLARLLIDFTDRRAALDAAPRLERWLAARHPDLQAVVRPLGYGPPVDAPVEVRIASDRDGVRAAVADSVRRRLQALPGARQVTDDWGPRVKTLAVRVDPERARRAGVTSQDVATSLRTGLDGLPVTEYRAAEEALPVLLRTPAGGDLDLARLATLEVYAPRGDRVVPLGQVADLEVTWQPPVIHRRDRVPTVTVSAQLAPGVTAAGVVQRLDPGLARLVAAQDAPVRYAYGGEVEASQQANASIYAKLPVAVLLVILLLVVQFNHVRPPLIILATIPLALIGVVVGLWLLDGVLGFMTLLGVISLAGIVINNAIVLLQRIGIEQTEQGRSPAAAVLAAAQQRLRPILLTAGTTIGGLLPLYLGGGPLWESLAITIIFGLAFSTLLTLGVVPVLHALLHGIRFDSDPGEGRSHASR